MTSLATQTHAAKIKAHIADAIAVVDFSDVDFELPSAADSIRDLIEASEVQLGLTFDSNIDMMSFISDVEGDIELEDYQLDFSKCSNYKEAMFIEFNAYMRELVVMVLEETVSKLVNQAEALIEAVELEYEEIDFVIVSNRCAYDAAPHSEEAVYNGGEGKVVEYHVWRKERVFATQVDNAYIMIVAKRDND